MMRLVVVAALLFPACSVLFNEEVLEPPAGIEPALQFAFEGSGERALQSTGVHEAALVLRGEANVHDGALDLSTV